MSELVELLFSEKIITYFQSPGSPFIDFLFFTITNIGSVPALFIFGVLIFWCFNKRTGIRMMYVILFSTYAAIFIKNLFGMPRPPEYLHKIKINGLGFPSGHAQVSSSFFGYLGLKVKKPWIINSSVAAILLISLSRVYLGVHYVGDIIGGIFFGLLVAFISFKTEPGIINRLQRQSTFKEKYFIAVMIPALLITVAFIRPGLLKEQIDIGFTMASIGIGYLLQEKNIMLDDAENNDQRIKRAFVGILLLAATYYISVLLSSINPAVVYLKYPALGFVSTFIAPCVFARMECRPH